MTTARVTFGDFISAAIDSLQQPIAAEPVARRRRAAVNVVQVQELTAGLYRVMSAMMRYLDDVTGAFAEVPAGHRDLLTSWPRASIQAREALGSAIAVVRPGAIAQEKRSSHPASNSLTGRLNEAAASLTAGRDLLHTHFAPRHDGGRGHQSEWAPVVVSVPVTRALLGELAVCARLIAPQAADLALSRATAQECSGPARRRLNVACQWLWVLHAAIHAANRQEPVTADERQLLYAIPSYGLSPRRLPEGTESVAELCEGTIDSAERVRQHAWAQASRPPWSPVLTVTSMRQIAATSTVINHNCEMLLRSLASAQLPNADPVTAELLESADAAARARASWLGIAEVLDNITTDTRDYVSPAAAESADLAIWTGRLAYADPQWTLGRRPAHPTQEPQRLALQPDDLQRVVAVAHQVSHTLARLAQAEQAQARAAAQSGRLLVPTRSLPESYDIPHPFACAPPDRVDALLVRYHDAASASAEATAAVARVATAVDAPSQVLTTAKATMAATANPTPQPHADRRNGATAVYEQAAQLPGPVERTLHDLGVSDSDLLRRAAAIDRAGERLIIETAEDLRPRRTQPIRPEARPSGQTALITNVLASGNTQAAALLRPSVVTELEPEIEP